MSLLVCDNCGSRALSTVETTHNPNSGHEVCECDDCGETGTLRWDASNGMELSGYLTLQPTNPDSPPVRR
jgi:hypothetical protein